MSRERPNKRKRGHDESPCHHSRPSEERLRQSSLPSSPVWKWTYNWWQAESLENMYKTYWWQGGSTTQCGHASFVSPSLKMNHYIVTHPSIGAIGQKVHHYIVIHQWETRRIHLGGFLRARKESFSRVVGWLRCRVLLASALWGTEVRIVLRISSTLLCYKASSGSCGFFRLCGRGARFLRMPTVLCHFTKQDTSPPSPSSSVLHSSPSWALPSSIRCGGRQQSGTWQRAHWFVVEQPLLSSSSSSFLFLLDDRARLSSARGSIRSRSTECTEFETDVEDHGTLSYE